MKNLRVTVNGTVYDVQVEETSASAPVSAPAAPVAAPVSTPAAAPAPAAPAAPTAAAPSANAVKVDSPMPGTIVNIKVSEGDTVKEGQVLLILEAMKMENEIMAPVDGKVAGLHVRKGDSVSSGQLLVSVE